MRFIIPALLLALIASAATIKLTGSVNFDINIDGFEQLVAKSMELATESESQTTPANSSANEHCDRRSCITCEKGGKSNFCTSCFKKNLIGTGDNRRCRGPVPTGCLAVSSVPVASSSQSVEYTTQCTACDSKNKYHLVRDTQNRCIKCDLSSNSLEKGICTPVPFQVDNCQSYSSGGKCSKCPKEYQLFETTNTCVSLPENCSRMRQDGTCSDCNSGYMREKGVWQCIPITLKNCASVEDSNQTRCQSCKRGFFVNEAATCSLMTISNCLIGNNYHCTICEDGYFMENSGLACIDIPSCSDGEFLDDGRFVCQMCNLDNGYFAVGVEDKSFSYFGKEVYGQICKKESELF